jgi:hypothetical protein
MALREAASSHPQEFSFGAMLLKNSAPHLVK